MRQLRITIMVGLMILINTQMAFAASGRCKVVSIQGSIMVLECSEKTKGFVQGDKVKIKTNRRQTVEGC